MSIKQNNFFIIIFLTLMSGVLFLVIALISCSTSDRVDFDGFYIKGRLNNQPEEVSMIIDTGAPSTLISQSLAKKLNIGLLEKIDSTYAPALKRKSATYKGITNLMIGSNVFNNVEVKIVDDSFFNPPLQAQVILGINVLEKCGKVTFNYEKKFLEIEDISINKNKNPNFKFNDDIKILIPVTVNNKRYQAFIDTGSPFSYLFTEYWDKDSYQIAEKREKRYGSYVWKQNYYKFDIGNKSDFPIMILDNKGIKDAHLLLGKDYFKELEIDFVNQHIQMR